MAPAAVAGQGQGVHRATFHSVWALLPGAVSRSSSGRGLHHVPPMLPRALLAAAILHGAVIPCPLFPEHCIPGSVRRGRAGNDPAARHAGPRHPFPPCLPEKTGFEKFANNARTGDACSHDNSRDASIVIYPQALTGPTRNMSAITTLVRARLEYLRVCYRSGLGLDAVIKISQETVSTILKTVSDFPKAISVETASELVALISEDLEMFSPEHRRELIDSINSKTSRPDVGCLDNSDVQRDTVAAEVVPRSKQSMYHIENYMTPEIWSLLRAPHVNREVAYLEISKLLVLLGLSRPKEPFWGHLLAFVQWATVTPLENPYKERDRLKAIWAEAKLNMNSAGHDVPTEYPEQPTKLMDTHPHIYLRAYSGSRQPQRPPPRMDIHSLRLMKDNTGCRNTKTSMYQDPCLQRHHLALETMLVLGKHVSATPPR